MIDYYWPDKKELTQRAARLGTWCYQVSAASYPNGAPWSEGTFRANLTAPHQYYLFAVVAGQLVGFISYTAIFDEVEITNVVVAPQYQRQHVAWQLWQILLQAQTQPVYFYLEVRASNLPAQKLYKKLGFTVINRRRAYYTTPVEDALIMALEWKESNNDGEQVAATRVNFSF
ncbi:ribosomal protein S18-alanine N-acetyltransferase [Loigolactobacillus coryniformis]|uniref:ribosomal protein S18-alanine N-acetyltransferase n=1 Tax=Loigolactobacillus coryniformis TaxID=1610 RepID=UPI002340863A|nr:ribosomal protein S18-alanine N-acetyltransferase [Loigolactobacillus coryniformis]MDC4186399.1 ribosomal protein S18-alanine N-acetyltransferase [Loigolactobacillus coryniformis]MDN5951301.1 ribosomal protein S18-alanine N-acetyltransferase [Loigolactobacillus coryniformis]MDN5953586.1 ribosomal protein S18-alanine N-acetyltransferase [Loigolactobacillus coryniformis]